jgi:hypothetical protein
MLLYRYLLVKCVKDQKFLKENLEKFKKVCYLIIESEIVWEDLQKKYDSLDITLLTVMLRDFDYDDNPAKRVRY